MADQDLHRLADPFIGFNELKAEWVGKAAWSYKLVFPSPHVPEGSWVALVFDGLDTFAEVKLDGLTILHSDNMFLPHRVDITKAISRSETHTLEVNFESAFLKGAEIRAQHPEHIWDGFNGDMGRLAVRKAQCHWGWDWGPILNCAGIWKPVRIEVYQSRIAELRTDVSLSAGRKSANVDITVHVGRRGSQALTAKISIRQGSTVLESTSSSVSNDGVATATLRLDNPDLWMPAGYGGQTLYEVDVFLVGEDSVLDKASKRIGIRDVELVQQPDKHGKSFFFRINGVDIFCGGSCWIPADSFLTNISAQRYRAWLELMVPANEKMIRVWGGGIYEDDAFYNACDELGILVWQDFMFGCGNYPAYPSMLESVKKEAIANVKRIRHHPSLVILAGNNEDYQVQESLGLEYNYEDKNEVNWLKSDFPARYYYESLLPKVVVEEAPSIPYHPGSPWGDGKRTSDPTVGDMHQWNVWHGTQEKYQIFDSLGGRFNSEFGMEAFPHIDTIRAFVEKEEDLFPQSHVMDFHNKADGHERRIATYLVENVRTNPELEAYIHLTQLIQCEALMYGYRGWRKQWGDDRRCGGALVWQLNDCWPVTSWSIVDYYLRRKPSYYAMARVLAPIAVGIRRQHFDWSVTHAREPKTQSWELWAVSSNLEPVAADIEVRFVSVQSGKDIKEKIVKKGIHLAPNGTTVVVSDGEIDNISEEPHLLAARIWVDGNLVSRDTDWPQPLKYLPFPDRNVKVDVRGNEMHVSVERPVKCLVFEEREGCHLSDSAIDVVPGDPQVVTVRGLKQHDKPLKWTFLGASEQ
jgi:beta-mannosidase